MITVKQLSSLRYLKREVNIERERLAYLKASAEYKTSSFDAVPKAKGVTVDRIGIYASEMAYLKELIADNMHRCICELLRLQEFINSITDSDLRQIFYLRYIKGKSWVSIAFQLELSDEQVARRRHDRFIKDYNQKNP